MVFSHTGRASQDCSLGLCLAKSWAVYRLSGLGWGTAVKPFFNVLITHARRANAKRALPRPAHALGRLPPLSSVSLGASVNRLPVQCKCDGGPLKLGARVASRLETTYVVIDSLLTSSHSHSLASSLTHLPPTYHTLDPVHPTLFQLAAPNPSLSSTPSTTT